MIENCVQHDLHSICMRAVDKFFQVLFTAEITVNLIIIAYIVFMVRIELKIGVRYIALMPKPQRYGSFCVIPLISPPAKLLGSGISPHLRFI